MKPAEVDLIARELRNERQAAREHRDPQGAVAATLRLAALFGLIPLSAAEEISRIDDSAEGRSASAC